MDRDRLVILGRNYGLHNLTQLPDDLKPFKVTSRENEECIGIFGALNPLSNFYPAKFTIGEETYISTEQYIQVRKAEYFKDKQSYDKIMCAISSLDCKNFAHGIRNFNRRMWESVAKEHCRLGIQAKFLQNPDLLQVLVEKTGHKTIVESANDRLWGTGIPLVREGCLNKEKWISPGILGELLMEIRENQTMFPTTEPAKLHTSMQLDALPGITNLSLSGVTSSANMAAVNPPILPSNTLPVTVSDTATPEVCPTQSKSLYADYPPVVTEATIKEQIQQVCDNPKVSADAPAMEVS